MVTLRKGDPEFLVAHVVFAAQHAITVKEAYLEQLLSHLPIPRYMVPIIAVALDEPPLTNHSKVDQKAVNRMLCPKIAESTHEDAELTERTVQLKTVWENVLEKSIKSLGLDITSSSNFFLIGGNSLLVIRLQSWIREAFHEAAPLIDLLCASTLSQIAHKIEETANVSLIMHHSPHPNHTNACANGQMRTESSCGSSQLISSPCLGRTVACMFRPIATR